MGHQVKGSALVGHIDTRLSSFFLKFRCLWICSHMAEKTLTGKHRLKQFNIIKTCSPHSRVKTQAAGLSFFYIM